jgi:glycosyltransferase involved in cell wall biosynthesis
MNKTSSVDCIICTYKDSHRLTLTLLSLSKQYQLKFNKIIIIVDDGYNSSIARNSLVKKFKKIINIPELKRIKKSIKIHYNKINLGLGVSRNIGIKLSKSKYFTFLDCGDELTLDFLLHFQKHFLNLIMISFMGDY